MSSNDRDTVFYEIETLEDLDKNVERFVKKKSFKSLPNQLEELQLKLINGEFPGDRIRHRDEPEPVDVYKLRLPNPDTNAGKSNGYRIIYIVVTERRIVVLLTIYYKKEQESVTDTYVNGLIDGYLMGL